MQTAAWPQAPKVMVLLDRKGGDVPRGMTRTSSARGAEAARARPARRQPGSRESQIARVFSSVGPNSATAPQAASRVPKTRRAEDTDQIDVSRLSGAERAALRRQLDRLQASRVAPFGTSTESGDDRSLDADYGLIAAAGAARTSREDEVRYRVDRTSGICRSLLPSGTTS